MAGRLIEIVKVLVEQVHKDGYQLRAVEDDIYAEKEKRAAAEKDRDHWRQARQDAIEAGELMKAEIETLRGAMAADDKRLRDAEERVWPGRTLGCDAPDAMADEILSLRTQFTDGVRQELESLKAKNLELLAKLATVENAAANENESLRQKLTAAEAAVSLQRSGIERLNAFVGKVRSVIDNDCDGLEIDEMIKALDELDAGDSEPAPATAPDEDDILDRIDGDALAAGITEVVREIVEGRKAKAAGNSSATPTGSPEPEDGQ